MYRDLVQREISELEGAVNLWKTQSYCGNDFCSIYAGDGFGGYQDWTYREFAAKISLRNDHAEDFEEFSVGTSGLCICCGDEISKGLYCGSCQPDDDEADDDDCVCEDCGDECDENYAVRNQQGFWVYVCADCRDENYTYCPECGEYHPNEEMVRTNDGCVCRACLDNHYTQCPHCEEYFKNAELSKADNHGESVKVCEDCRHLLYAECEECGEAFRMDDMQDGLCPDCKEKAEGEAA